MAATTDVARRHRDGDPDRQGRARPPGSTLALANRHGLVTGATGTGKTVTLQVLAEGFARAGVPVFAADIKGDLSGIAAVGRGEGLHRQARARTWASTFQPDQFPTVFWDVFGEQGHPVRATVSEMGPLLLARMLDLNDVQEGVLNIAFRVADEHGLPLLDLKDLRAMLDAIAPSPARRTKPTARRHPQGRAELRQRHARRPIGTIQRQLLVLENQGGDKFFGEPALELKDFMRTDRDGRGIVNILAADKLMENAAALRDVPAVDAVRTVRGTARGRRPAEAEARVLLRRGASAVQRCAEGADGQDRAGGAPDPLQGRRRLFRHAEPDRRAGQGAGAARQPRAARAARLHAARPEGGAGRGGDVPRQPEARHREVITELGKGEALVSFLEGNGTPAMVERVHGPPAVGADRADHAGRSARRSSRRAR